MEATENTFAALNAKKRKKRIRNLIVLFVALAVVAVSASILVKRVRTAAQETSVLTYRAGTVSSGEVSATIGGSGTIAALSSESVTAKAASTVERVHFAPGDAIEAGQIVMTLTSDEIHQQLDELNDELLDVRTKLAGTKQFLTSMGVTAPKAGIVKSVVAAVGDVVDDMPYLCLISTDGRMRLTIDAPDGLKQYDDVLVQIGDDEQDGVVTALEDGKATIVFDDKAYLVGEQATATDSAGVLLGSGAIDVNEYVPVTAQAGRIATVSAAENKRVGRGGALFTLASGAPTSKYLTYKEEEQELLEQIAKWQEGLTIAAQYDCVLTSLSVKAGDEVSAGGSLCTLTGVDGFSLKLAIDELDIASVKLGQSATVTLDAIEGERYAGSVTNISYDGSGSYVTSYTATVTTEPIPQAYPGMSAAVEIVIQTSGESLIVPVSAVQYEGEKAYLTLADEGVPAGTIVSAEELPLDSLTKVYVTTGMSDGSYIVVAGEGLRAGERIWINNRSTTASYVESESASDFGFGAMGGGAPPSGEFGGDMGDGRGQRRPGEREG